MSTTTESPAEQIKRQIEDPDETHVGPYEKNGDNAIAIETLAWAVGLRITDEGYCEPVESPVPERRLIDLAGDDLGQIIEVRLIGAYATANEYAVLVSH